VITDNGYTLDDFMRDVFDASCPHLESRDRFKSFYEVLGQSPIQRAQQVVVDRIDFIDPQGPRIIELGCHVGFNCIHYAKLGYDVTGVDIAASLIKEAELRKAALPLPVQNRVRFIQSWIEDINIDEPAFDDVILTATLEHVINPAAIVMAAARWLAPTGSMWISAPNTRTGNYSHVRGVTENDLSEWLHAAGLAVQTWSSTPKETRAEARWRRL